jgi:alpha/beta superfamily hydrolase
MGTEPRTLTTDDGLTLEAEYAAALVPIRGAAVLCHPHPQYGGTMRSIVVSALFGALPARGIACLRFNFRGVEGSEGSHGGGEEERHDAQAAVDTMVAEVGASVALALIGWSFGADVALSVSDHRLRGWVGIAPPLRFGNAVHAVAHDPRPKLLVLAAHDEFREPAEIQREVAGWTSTRVEVIPGASHFFVGRTDRVVEAVGEFLDVLTR